MNFEVAKRWEVHGNVAKYLGNGNDTFLAERTSYGAQVIAPAPPFNVSPYPFEDDSTPPNNDVNGNYDNTTYRYTCPSDGMYFFNIKIRFSIFAPFSGSVQIKIFGQRFDAGSNLIQSNIFIGGVRQGFDEIFEEYYSFNNFMLAGEFMNVSIDVNFISGNFIFQFLPGATFDCTQTSNGGGIYQPQDTFRFTGVRFAFDYPISEQQFDFIKQQTINLHRLSHNGATYQGAWIKKLSRKMKDGLTKCEFITTFENCKNDIP